MSRRNGLTTYYVYVPGSCSATVKVDAATPEEAAEKVKEFSTDCEIYDECGPEYDFWAVTVEDVDEAIVSEMTPFEEEDYE